MGKDTIQRLTPYMNAYSKEFSDNGNINWLPYTMYFHPFGFVSDVVNTDARGFRYSDARGQKFSVADCDGVTQCRLLAGSSTAFGIGASSDKHTIASRLTEIDPRGDPWLNFGGRSFNSTQEMIQFSLHRHMLPKLDEVVLLSGFNDLGLARLPEHLKQEHGAFFMCNEFYNAMQGQKPSLFSRWFQDGAFDVGTQEIPTLEEQIDYAVERTLRNLTNWRAMCRDMNAKLTYVLQPLESWVRETGSLEEMELFEEREKRGGFAEQYGDILSQQTYTTYRDQLRDGTERLGINFIDLTLDIRAAIADDYWLFVDRIHFTDQGHDLVSNLILRRIDPPRVSGV
ncbi:MAG: SGNH/GDSL hydrolase family protein [Rhodobacteraceae bacterium]|nr:SGNH/GDSL hydrolase family protein [Paracoccaceae bacterium]